MVFVCGSQLYHVCYGFYFFPISCYTIFIRNIRFRLQCTKKCCIIFERLAEMAELVEGARLEIVFTGNRNKGSNPFLCAKQKSTQKGAFFVYAMKEEGIRRERPKGFQAVRELLCTDGRSFTFRTLLPFTLFRRGPWNNPAVS